MIKLQFKTATSINKSGFTRRTVFHAPAFYITSFLILTLTVLTVLKNLWVSTDGDGINCDDAELVGNAIQEDESG